MKFSTSAVSVAACLVACFVLFAASGVKSASAQEPVAVSVLEVAPTVDGGSGEVDRERVLAFKVALNQLAESKKFRLFQALKLRRAANDDAVCEYLALKYQEQLDEVAAQAVAGEGFMKWIEWVIQNQDSIIKFVTTLIDLFGANKTDRIFEQASVRSETGHFKYRLKDGGVGFSRTWPPLY